MAAGPFLEVATTNPVSSVTDLGEVVLLPGFVNAHTHLELSFLRGRVPFSGAFDQWLELVGSYLVSAPRRELERAAAAGVEESLGFGTTVAGDVSLRVPAFSEMRRRGLAGVCYLEVLGLRQRWATGTLRKRRLQLFFLRQDQRVRLGLSPHAPYSTSEQGFRESLQLARRYRAPVLTHVAETKEEVELMAKGSGPLADLIERRRWTDAGLRFIAPECSPIRYLERIGFLSPSALLAHANYVERDDLERIAASGASVAFCPRSHRFFGHDPYPLAQMLDFKINVALGTDSLASNDSLSMLHEARALRQTFPNISPLIVFEMLTCNGARALGLQACCGQIGQGSYSDFVATPKPPGLPGPHGREILESLLHEAPPVRLVRC